MKITRLVCSGGGAKGVIYSGAYDALVETNAIKNIRDVAGSSAGAINAAFIAVGMPPKKLRETLLSTNIKNLLGKRLPGTITKDGTPMLDLLREKIAESVSDFLKNNIAKISDNENKKTLLAIDEKLKARAPITFRDLHALQQIFPDTYKSLTITAVSTPDGDLQIFKYETTPDVEIALACRASASIPIILEPTKIIVNDIEQTFIDGGVYDNIPTDYFDKDEKGVYRANDKKEETLILAFGDGLNNKKNPVFQALHNGRLIQESLLERILEKAIQNYGVNPHMSLKEVIHHTIDDYVDNKTISRQEADQVIKAVKSSSISSNDMSVDMLKNKLKPTLYHANFFERFKRNMLVQWWLGFKADYKNTERKEVGFQKLKNDYREQTIELRVGNITTTDFNPAQRVARELSAMGYLDAMSYQKQHGMTPEKDVYVSLLEKFKRIHKAVVLGSSQSLQKNELMQEITKQEEKGTSPADIVSLLIKPYVEKNLHTSEAFALSRAVEWHTGNIENAQLLIETHAKSRQQQWLSKTEFNPENSDELITQAKQQRLSPEITSKTQHKTTDDQSLNISQFKKFKTAAENVKSKRSEIVSNALFNPGTGKG